jgi:hypothetical protein
MIRHFVDWFSISLQHSFFADGKCRNMDIIPSKTTVQFMRQYELVGGVQHGVFSMKYAQNENDRTALSQLKTPQVLRFFLQNKDPYFSNFTQIAFFNPSSTILFLNNLNSTQGILSVEASVGDQDLLPVHPARFETESANGVFVSLRDAQNRVLIPTTDQKDPLPWVLMDSEGQALRIKVNLEGFPPGKYGLEQQDGQIQWFFLQDAERQINYTGVIDLYIGAENSFLKLPIQDNQEVFPTPFVVAFEARSSTWQYLLINRSKLTFDHLEVFNVEDSSFSFKTMEQPLRNEEAFLCASEKPLPLKERQNLRPKLRVVKKNESGGFSPDPMVLDLPTPDIKILARNTSSANGNPSASDEFEVYSNMYIYL